MCNEHFDNARTRILMKNMAYVGTLAALLELDRKVIEHSSKRRSRARRRSSRRTWTRSISATTTRSSNFECPLPTRVKALDKTAGHIMIDGNTAAALGCVYAGATVGAWYPITPSTSLMDAFKAFCERYRKDPKTGEKLYCIVQAEDELAAIGIVLGATWNGARAFTPTSGPGHLADERVPGLRVLHRAARGGVRRAARGPVHRHADAHAAGRHAARRVRVARRHKHVAAVPARSRASASSSRSTAFDLADRLQTPVFVLSDLDIGMNDWMCKDLEWDPTYKPDRGKVLTAEQLESMQDVPPLPRRGRRRHPVSHAARRAPARRVLRPRLGTQPVRRRTRKTRPSTSRWWTASRRNGDTAAQLVPRAVVRRAAKAANGASSRSAAPIAAVHEALDRLAEKGIHVDYCRIRAFPFGAEVAQFLEQHERVFVVDQNRDAQLKSLLVLETGHAPQRLQSILHYGGLPMDCRCVVDALELAAAQGEAA